MNCTIEGCEKPEKARGWCPAHLSRFYRNGTTDNPRPSLEDRLARLLQVRDMGYATPCHVFTGTLTPEGYGRVKVDGVKTFTHRLLWEARVGPIPAGLEIDHLCRVRSCANPAHLEPVTPQVNQLRGFGFSGINGRKAECVRGHELTPENVYLTKRNMRQCRECRKVHQANYRAKRRAA